LGIIGKTIAVYFFIVLAIRLFGKKEISQLSVVDLVFILLISNAVQNAMVGDDTSLPGGLVAAGALFLMNALLKEVIFRSKKASQFIQGEPVMLIHEGQLIVKNLQQEKISVEELEAAIREHGVNSIREVNLAVLEVDGNISILSNTFQNHSRRKRKSHRAVNASK
jgi:uncharacterized membrane protein YcaP (DUF421 family)